MKKIALRILILFTIFVVSLIGFMLMTDKQDALSTKEMSEPTLPVLYMQVDGITVNRMYGYTQEINEASFRESLTPVTVDKNLTVEIQLLNSAAEEVNYQLSDLEDGSLLENGRLSLETTDGNMISEFHINASIAIDKEYMLKFTVNTKDGTEVYYYTRLVQNSGQSLSYYLEYADAFYQNCISGSITSEMLSQMETDSTASNSSLHLVTLKSDSEQIAWGDMSPTLVKKAVPTILEVNETTVSIGMEYIVSALNEEGETEYYTATEYYRMRRSKGEIILLDYERTVTQYFDADISVLTDDGISLGVTGRSIEYATNSSADIVAFVQAGELWQYDISTNKACCIFSFRSEGHTDERCENNLYDISVSAVDEDGDTTFLVYGYMAAGDHEGALAIAVYKYFAATNITKELLFIPISDSYALMSQSLSVLSYVNSENCCFLYYDGTIYTVDISDDAAVSVLHSDIEDGSIYVSESKTLIAWTEGDGDYFDTLYELNLETGETLTIAASEGEYIEVLGYINEDLIYGLAKEDDCYTDAAGNAATPMYRVSIISSDNEVVCEYCESGIYITGIETDDELITLSRACLDADGELKEMSDYQLLYYAPQEDLYVNVSLVVSERNGTLVQLDFSVSGDDSTPLCTAARYLAEDEAMVLEISQISYAGDCYYVYAHGGLYGVYAQINAAVSAAYENMGVVIDSSQSYVWEKGNISTSITLDSSKIPDGLLSAPVDEEEISQAVGDEYKVVNLTGCCVDSILYFISSGYAVTGQWSDDEAVLIVGYDTYNLWLYDEAAGEAYAVALEDAEAAFGECGNIFMSYS